MCPLCHHTRTSVIRTTHGAEIRRVRVCDSCGNRWVTLEVPADTVAKARAVLDGIQALSRTVLP
jgi:transcriptional regulator NrdR family protein